MADAKAAALDNEADVEEGADGASEQPKKKFALKLPPLKFLIIGGAAFLLLAGGGAGAYFFFFSHKPEHKVETPGSSPRCSSICRRCSSISPTPAPIARNI